jgi:hypothetical protein
MKPQDDKKDSLLKIASVEQIRSDSNSNEQIVKSTNNGVAQSQQHININQNIYLTQPFLFMNQQEWQKSTEHGQQYMGIHQAQTQLGKPHSKVQHFTEGEALKPMELENG